MGLGLLSAGLILYELALTRVLSALFYHHTAYLAFALAMLGLGAGALWVSQKRSERISNNALIIAATALAMFVFPILAPHLSLTTSKLADYANRDFLISLCLAIAAATLPFFLAGMAFARLYAEHTSRIARLYASDLTGAAVGTLLVVPVMSYFGGSQSLCCAAVLVAVAPLFIAKQKLWILLPLALALLTFLIAPSLRLALEGDDSESIRKEDIVFEKWNAFSRITLLKNQGFDRGMSEAGLEKHGDHLAEQMEAIIDINAFAPMLRFDGDLEKLAYLADLVENRVYSLAPQNPKVAILGPGCGKDVVAALVMGAEKVVGFEINEIMVEDIVRGEFVAFSGGIYDHPQVDLRIADARRGLRESAGGFDLILANSVATWAGQSSGAMALSENHLFSVEAFQTYREQLKASGLVAISLWQAADHAVVARLIACWQEANHWTNEEVAQRVLLVSNPWDEGRYFSALILARESLASSADAVNPAVANFAQESEELGFEFLYGPGHPDRFGVLPAAEHGDGLRRDAVYDNSPFVFYTLRPKAILGALNPKTQDDNAALYSLAWSLIFVSTLLVAMLANPLWRRRHEAQKLAAGDALCFALLGLGFMTLELSLLADATLRLGHPTSSLLWVLPTLLVGAACGGAAIHTLQTPQSGRLWWPTLLGFSLLAPLALYLPTEGMNGPAFAVMVLAIAFGMGLMMPLILRNASQHCSRQAIAFGWGLNACFGVLASVISIPLAILVGYSALRLFAVACYASVVLIQLWLSVEGRRRSS